MMKQKRLIHHHCQQWSKPKVNMKIINQLAVIIAMTTFIAGCYTQSKAIKQVEHATLRYPAMVAAKTRDNFPCVVKDDSTGYLVSKRYVDSLISISDSIMFESQSMAATIPFDTSGLYAIPKIWKDSVTSDTTITYPYKGTDYGYIRIKAMVDLKRINDQLKYQINQFHPIEKATVDQAAVKAIQGKYDDCQNNYNTLVETNSKNHSKAVTYFWLMVMLGASTLFSTFKWITKPKINV